MAAPRSSCLSEAALVTRASGLASPPFRASAREHGRGAPGAPLAWLGLVPLRRSLLTVALVLPLVGACAIQDPLGIEGRKAAQGVPGPRDAAISSSEPTDASDEASIEESTPPPGPVDSGGPDTAPPPPPTYLSDLTLEVVSNGYGPLEKDMSVGEINAGDGTALTLNGVVYKKGLGAHAASEINVNLGGQYKTFIADVGVDDDAAMAGSVRFVISADGMSLFDSGVMTGASATKSVSVNVTGKKQLKLVVSDGGDGISFDHADWAGARLTK